MREMEKRENIKKGLYLLYNSIDLNNPSGIEYKILKQKDLFEELGILMDIRMLEKKNNTFWNYKSDYSSYDFVYFRKGTIIDSKFVSFFRTLKKENPSIKIFMDIPTYPYEGEFDTTIKSKIALLIDRIFRNRLIGLIDRVVVTGQYNMDKIWGIEAISIVNGIDVKNISVCEKIQRLNNDIIISCIARFSPWHGYERIIDGLSEYYNKKRERIVKLFMVGDGPEKVFYETLVVERNLQKYVTFTGQLRGEELERIYNQTDLGCCSLGRYKSNLDVIGDLKSREFLAKGIPLICGCQIDVLINKDFMYCLNFPNDNSTINIEEIVEFYNEITTKGEESMKEEIRDFAMNNVDIRTTYRPVLKEVEKLLW